MGLTPDPRRDPDDPRSGIEKMTRDELFYYGKAHGIEFPDGINTLRDDPTNLNRPNMIGILRAHGLDKVNIHRTLGQPEIKESVPIRKIFKLADPSPDGSKQFEDREPAAPEPPAEPIDPDKMTIQQLRKACKERGIKIDRKDTIAVLRDRLRGQNAP